MVRIIYDYNDLLVVIEKTQKRKYYLLLKDHIQKDNISNFINLTNVIYKQKYYILYAHLRITDSCNMRCKHCYLGGRLEHNSHGKVSKIKSIVDKIRDIGAYQISLTGGEPLLHHELNKIVRYAYSKDFVVHIPTNGVLLSKKINSLIENGMYSLSISFDTTVPSKFSYFRGTDGKFLNDVINGIKLASKYRQQQKLANLVIFTMLTSINRDNLVDIFELLSKYTIDLWNIERPYLTGSFITHGKKLWVDIYSVLKLTGELLDICKEKDNIGINYISIDRKVIINTQKCQIVLPVNLPNTGSCGAHERMLVVDFEGFVHWCPLLEETVGNILEDPIDKIPDIRKQKFYEIYKRIENACKQCTLYNICRGSCYIDVTNKFKAGYYKVSTTEYCDYDSKVLYSELPRKYINGI